MPSQLDLLFWRCSLGDLLKQIELKFSFQQVMVWQDYQNLILTATAVFGKKDSQNQPPRDAAEAKDQIDRLLGKKR